MHFRNISANFQLKNLKQHFDCGRGGPEPPGYALATSTAWVPDLIAYTSSKSPPLAQVYPFSNVSVFSHLSLLLETSYNHSHSQTCRHSGLLSSNFSYFMYIQTRRALGFQSSLFYLESAE